MAALITKTISFMSVYSPVSPNKNKSKLFNLCVWLYSPDFAICCLELHFLEDNDICLLGEWHSIFDGSELIWHIQPRNSFDICSWSFYFLMWFWIKDNILFFFSVDKSYMHSYLIFCFIFYFSIFTSLLGTKKLI